MKHKGRQNQYNNFNVILIYINELSLTWPMERARDRARYTHRISSRCCCACDIL